MNKKEAIAAYSGQTVAVYGVTNSIGVAIHAVEDERVLASYQLDGKIVSYHWVELKQKVKGAYYFKILLMEIFLDECIRI